MAQRHDRCRPECDDEAEIDRVPDHPIEAGHLELDRLAAAKPEMSDHLHQAEQLEMVDQESTVKHDEPAEKASGNRDRDKRRRLDLPNDRRDWLPLPEQ